MESGQSMPFGVRKFWALSWCQYLPAGWTWASSLTFTSTDFLIHNLEITVGKSWSSTIIMVFYIITQLRKACFWKSASGLFFFWLPLAFLAQDLFQHHVYLLLGEESPGGILSWKWAMDKQKKKKFCTSPFLTKGFAKCGYPEVVTPWCLQQDCYLRSKGHETELQGIMDTCPMSSPSYLLWAIGPIVGEEGQIVRWLER